MSCFITSYDITLYYNTINDVILYHVLIYSASLHHIIYYDVQYGIIFPSHSIISNHIMLSCITLYHSVY